MKSPNLLSIFSTLLILIIPFISAWPWPIELPEAGALVARQNSNSGRRIRTENEKLILTWLAAQPTQTQAPSSSQVSSSASQSNSGSNQPSSTNSNSNSNSNSQTASITGLVSGGSSSVGSATRASGTNYKNSTLSAIDPRDPPGGVSMITPAATDGMTFVKVGNYVTFKWNYTRLDLPKDLQGDIVLTWLRSLLRAPSYIDVIATNTVNSQTYTIASNQTWQSTQAITWDTGSWTQTTDLPFVIATYTLMVSNKIERPTLD